MDKKLSGSTFRFRRNENIGAAEAETDDAFLLDCFVDNGDLDVLLNTEDPRRIVVGRTGSGKSALLRLIRERSETCVALRPEELSLSYLSNSEVIRFFEDAGANLDSFYQLLWKHIIAVELIKKKYKINNEQAQKNFWDRLLPIFNRDKAKQAASDYLRQWGDSFWNETEYRVKEVSSRIERELSATMGGEASAGKISGEYAKKMTFDQRNEVIQRGSQAVTKIQVSALSNLIRLLHEEIFSDEHDSYYVLIDDLDIGWVEDRLKLKLIRALLETIRSFKQVKRAKVIVAMRQDLLRRVLDSTKSSGFQSEKYESLYLTLRWRKSDIIDLIDRRLMRLVRARYTSSAIGLNELFPSQIRRVAMDDYIVDRTFLRPRDAIIFVNECLQRAVEYGKVTQQMVLDAEAAYSERRRISLEEEWGSIYPAVSLYFDLLRGRDLSFKLSSLKRAEVEAWLVEHLDDENVATDPVIKAATDLTNDNSIEVAVFLRALSEALYTTGMVGLKVDAQHEVNWPHFSNHMPPIGSINGGTTVFIHPMFWRVLGVDGATPKAR